MVIKLDSLNEFEKKAHLKFAYCFPTSFALIKKEGAITFGKKVLELAEKTIRSDHENCICENCCGYQQFKANLEKELKLLGGETK
jgi:hypothetical protein